MRSRLKEGRKEKDIPRVSKEFSKEFSTIPRALTNPIPRALKKLLE